MHIKSDKQESNKKKTLVKKLLLHNLVTVQLHLNSPKQSTKRVIYAYVQYILCYMTSIMNYVLYQLRILSSADFIYVI